MRNALRGVFFFDEISTLDLRVLIVYNEFMKNTMAGVYYAQKNKEGRDTPPGKGV